MPAPAYETLRVKQWMPGATPCDAGEVRLSSNGRVLRPARSPTHCVWSNLEVVVRDEWLRRRRLGGVRDDVHVARVHRAHRGWRRVRGPLLTARGTTPRATRTQPGPRPPRRTFRAR